MWCSVLFRFRAGVMVIGVFVLRFVLSWCDVFDVRCSCFERAGY